METVNEQKQLSPLEDLKQTFEGMKPSMPASTALALEGKIGCLNERNVEGDETDYKALYEETVVSKEKVSKELDEALEANLKLEDEVRSLKTPNINPDPKGVDPSAPNA